MAAAGTSSRPDARAKFVANVAVRGETSCVPFFEPLPPPPEPPSPDQPTGWVPPLWDRPNEALLGAPVLISVLLARTDDVALAFDDVRAYPNGFTFALVTVHNPTRPDPAMHGMRAMSGSPLGPLGPRVGFEFSDGRRVQVVFPFRPPGPGSATTAVLAVRRVPPGPPRPPRPPGVGPMSPFGASLPGGSDGVPDEPVLRMQGGGGNGRHFAQRYWCFMLPPPGPLTVYAEWEVQGIGEVSAVVDADEILAAVPRVQTIWELGS